MKKILALSAFLLMGIANAKIVVAPLSIEKWGAVKQIDVAEDGTLVAINENGQLWQLNQGKAQLLLEKVSSQIAPKADYGRIALADSQGKFLLWTPTKVYRSDIVMAEKAEMQALAFATIGVVKNQQNHRLARIETQGEKAVISALSEENVLPDARPLQMDFHSENAKQGHIVVLATPDQETYQHGVLGDKWEAKSLIYLERHSLKPLAKPLILKDLVFEANQLSVLSSKGKSEAAVVISGNGAGARVVLVGLENGQLTIKTQSEPLPANRWQSPFVFNQTLYAVQMPHLLGKLVAYRPDGAKLQAAEINSGLSNHMYGSHETNLTATTSQFSVIPQYGYTQISVLNQKGVLEKYTEKLPANIQKTRSDGKRVYLLLENGQIWTVENQ